MTARIRHGLGPLTVIRYGLSALVLLWAVLVAGQARAFVSSTTGNAHYFWKESCAPVTIYLNGFPKASGMTPDQIVKSVAAAAHAWSTQPSMSQNGCTPYLEIVPTLAPASAAPPTVAWDARNSIIFRTEMWSKSGTPGRAYAPEALAVTSVTARSDGHIVDVDMEINGLNQSWMNLDPGVAVPFDQSDKQVYDLQNALTHEFGHFIGLGHTCFVASADNPSVGTDGKPRPTDNTGAFIPDCGPASPPRVQMSVMYNVTVAGETSKRFLSDDDIDAVCTIYAPTQPHDACALDSANPGCAVAPPRAARRADGRWALGLPAVSLAVASILAARRRARVSARDRARS